MVVEEDVVVGAGAGAGEGEEVYVCASLGYYCSSSMFL